MNTGEKEYIMEAHQQMEAAKWDTALDLVYQGLQHNNRSHELYFMLAQCKEMQGKQEQAAFSYQNALFYSPDEDYDLIEECYRDFIENSSLSSVQTSIVLVTYNQLEMTKLCVESIRYNNPYGSYEIIIVDNLSTDGTREWLKEQEDIKIILNEKNAGFPAACNQGAAIAAEGNDIFLLNNDTILMENSLYNLHMALYEEEKTGASGACSNRIGGRQQISEQYETVEEYAAYAGTHNCYSPKAHKKRLRLIGFALLVKRQLWDHLGGFDEIYGIGNCEDDDLSLKLLTEEYSLIFCRDSFIYHFGGASFQTLEHKKRQEYKRILLRNKKLFEEKWGIRWGYFSHTRYDLLNYIEEPEGKEMDILEIGCASGATLLEIGNRYPNAALYGMELDKRIVEIASNYLTIVQGDIEKQENPYQKSYDYIICADLLEYLREPEAVLGKIKGWLKPEGHIIISVPNIMHISVIEPLLHGELTYKEEGNPDRMYLKFFTRKELISIAERCGLELERFGGNMVELSDEEEKYIQRIRQMDDTVPEEEFRVYQYRVKLRNS